jgi:uncharacterized membrane protein YagU involved in acid resistance
MRLFETSSVRPRKTAAQGMVLGGIAGAIGAATMIPLRLGARRFGLVNKTVPQAIEESLATRAGVGRRFAAEAHHVADELLHVGFGSTLGAVYGLVVRGARRESVLGRGLLFGAAAWLFGAGIVVPLLGAARPLWRAQPSEQLVNVAAHLLFGVSAALVADELATQDDHRPTSDQHRRWVRVG